MQNTPLTIAILGTWGKFSVQVLLQSVFREYGGRQPKIFCIPTNVRTSAANYIAQLQPDILVLTNSGSYSVPEGETVSIFASEQAQKIAECFTYLPAHAQVVINLDDPEATNWLRYSTHMHQVTYTIYNVIDADYVLFQAIFRPRIGNVMLVNSRMQQFSVKTALLGESQWSVILAALAVLVELRVPELTLCSGIAAVTDIPSRLQVCPTRWPHLLLFDDTHDSTPFSVEIAIELMKCYTHKTILVLGDLIALGENASAAHEAVGKRASVRDIDELLPLGFYAEPVLKGYGRGEPFQFPHKLVDYILALSRQPTIVLVAGSKESGSKEVIRGLTFSPS